MHDSAQQTASTGVRGFTRGVSAALQGFGSALGNRAIRQAYVRLVLALFVASTAIGAAMVYGLWQFSEPSPDSMWIIAWAMWALRIAGVVIVLIAAPVVALFVINLLFPLFAEAVFFASLRHIDTTRAQPLESRPGLPIMTSVGVALRVLIHFLGLTILAMLSVFVPIVGPVFAPIFQAWVTARTLGWELLDPYFDKQEMRFAAQRDYVNRYSKAITGFGLPYSFLFAIPLIGPLFFGLGQAAAPMLLVRVLEPSGTPGFHDAPR